MVEYMPVPFTNSIRYLIQPGVERARQVAREYHDWDIPPEDEIREAAMAGR